MAAIVVAAALSISTVVVVSYASSHVTADAGPDQTVTEGDTVRLSGTTIGSNPSDTLTYGWSQENAPFVTLSDDTITNPTFVAPQVGATTKVWFVFQVYGDDDFYLLDDVAITILDKPRTRTFSVPFFTPVGDTTNPEIISVERVGNDTRVLGEPIIFNVTFSEPVTGVNATDFALLSGNETITISNNGTAFNSTVHPGMVVPDLGSARSVIDVHAPGATTKSGTAWMDIDHLIPSSLTIDLVAPDCTVFNLHNRTVVFRYEWMTPMDIQNVTGMPADGPWTLVVEDHEAYWNGTLFSWGLTLQTGPAIAVNGTGANYTVEVHPVVAGRYNLTLVDDHRIRDISGNGLVDAAPTGANHDYLVVSPTRPSC